jgi:hypothetical protein
MTGSLMPRRMTAVIRRGGVKNDGKQAEAMTGCQVQLPPKVSRRQRVGSQNQPAASSTPPTPPFTNGAALASEGCPTWWKQAGAACPHSTTQSRPPCRISPIMPPFPESTNSLAGRRRAPRRRGGNRSVPTCHPPRRFVARVQAGVISTWSRPPTAEVQENNAQRAVSPVRATRQEEKANQRTHSWPRVPS